MTIPAGADAVAAAAGNWRWLTRLNRSDDALVVADAADPLSGILALQFTRVVALDRARDDTPGALAALPDGSFDYILLPDIFGWWPGGTTALLHAAHRLVRADGWIALAGHRRHRPAGLAASLRRVGFRDVRSYGLAPSPARPFMVIPRTRTAALAWEQDRQRQEGGNRLRVVLAAAGLHDLLYRGWLALAAR